MKVELIVNITTDISDNLALSENAIVEGIFACAERIISDGGKVVVQRKLENEGPEVLAIFDTKEALKSWKDYLNGVQKALGKPPLA